ncbi:hypothetical protein PENTCL1PPCAC_1096, partial [Pristionchus entomophagus]
ADQQTRSFALQFEQNWQHNVWLCRGYRVRHLCNGCLKSGQGRCEGLQRRNHQQYNESYL